MTMTDTNSNTHKNLIRRRLTEGGSISPLEALRDFGCYRLASRISDLRREGMHIAKRIEESVSRITGKTVRYSRYFLSDDKSNGESCQTPHNQ